MFASVTAPCYPTRHRAPAFRGADRGGMLTAVRWRLDGRQMSDKPIRRKPYNTREAAEVLDVSQRTVIRLCDAGEIECYWTPGGGQRRIRVRDLQRYIERSR